MNELNSYILSGGGVVIALLFGAVIWFIQRLIKTLDRIDARVYQIDTIIATSDTRLKTVESELIKVTNEVDDIRGRFLVLETEHRNCTKCHPTR
jgi:hypothetical protein